MKIMKKTVRNKEKIQVKGNGKMFQKYGTVLSRQFKGHDDAPSTTRTHQTRFRQKRRKGKIVDKSFLILSCNYII